MVTALKRVGWVWCAGLALFALRFLQLAFDFDPVTLLHTPSLIDILMIALLATSALAAFLLSRSALKDRPLFSEYFAAPAASTTVLVCAAFLLAAGGALVGLDAVSNRMGAAPLATGVLALASFVGFLVLTRQMRADEAASVAPALPVMFFSAFWVLTLYLPAAGDPVLARYCLPILAAAVAACAFAQLAGFFRGETRPRTFRFTASVAVILCLGAAAQLNAHSLLFAGCALLLSVFLTLSGRQTAE